VNDHTVNPDKVLAAIRDCMNRWDKADSRSVAEAQAGFDLVEQVALMDSHLKNGGQLPRDWQPEPMPLPDWISKAAELYTENQRLKNELDSYQGRTVYFALDRDLERLMSELFGDLNTAAGVIARATDTGREFELFYGEEGRYTLADRFWKAR
jgi:hypothetical protein